MFPRSLNSYDLPNGVVMDVFGYAHSIFADRWLFLLLLLGVLDLKRVTLLQHYSTDAL